jgi:DNA-directed RNA polymerase subunit RPC12/RpoP
MADKEIAMYESAFAQILGYRVEMLYVCIKCAKQFNLAADPTDEELYVVADHAMECKV